MIKDYDGYMPKDSYSITDVSEQIVLKTNSTSYN